MTVDELMPELERLAGSLLECDGLTRVCSHLLHKHGIDHLVWAGAIEWCGRWFPIHFWIELPDGRTVDFRLRQWVGRDAPHGVFVPPPELVRRGRQVNIPCSDDLYAFLVESAGGLGAGSAVRDPMPP